MKLGIVIYYLPNILYFMIYFILWFQSFSKGVMVAYIWLLEEEVIGWKSTFSIMLC